MASINSEHSKLNPELERAIEKYKSESTDLFIIQTYDNEEAAKKTASEMQKFLAPNSSPNTIAVRRDMSFENPIFQVVVNRENFKSTALLYEKELVTRAVSVVRDSISLDGMIARIEILMGRTPNPFQGEGTEDSSILRLDHELKRVKVLIAGAKYLEASKDYIQIKSNIDAILNQLEKEVESLRLTVNEPNYISRACIRMMDEIQRAKKGEGTEYLKQTVVVAKEEIPSKNGNTEDDRDLASEWEESVHKEPDAIVFGDPPAMMVDLKITELYEAFEAIEPSQLTLQRIDETRRELTRLLEYMPSDTESEFSISFLNKLDKLKDDFTSSR